MTPTPQAGDECPACHSCPVYDDAGLIICANCGSTWDATGKADDWEDEDD